MSERLHPMTEAQYLAWENQQEVKHEFDGLRPIAMTGATNRHERIQGNLKFALISRLRGGACTPYGPNTRIATGQGRHRYPDALVTCAPQDDMARQVTDPVLIFEIICDTTQRTDRSTKLVEYRSIPSLVRYVMLEQDKVEATIITRVADHWSIDLLRAGDVLDLPEIGITLPLDALYEGIDLSAAPA